MGDEADDFFESRAPNEEVQVSFHPNKNIRQTRLQWLADVFFLARRYPAALQTQHFLSSASTNRIGPSDLNNSVQVNALAYKMIKLHFAVIYGDRSYSPLNGLPVDILLRLVDQNGSPVIQRAARLLSSSMGGPLQPFASISRAIMGANGAYHNRLSITFVRPETDPLPPGFERLKEALSSSLSYHAGSVSASHSIMVRLPPSVPNGCCPYRDFAQGVLELAWSLNLGPPPIPQGNLTAFTPVLIPGQDDFALAHSHGHAGEIGWARLDQGFVQQVSGKERSVRIVPLPEG